MPISKILIANRGEIAIRVARACADMGLQSVAVYADPDRDAQHVRYADEAFALNGARAADTYLDIDKLIDVAQRSGADAVHPGYGFLSENAAFAQAVIDAGLTWIGPPPHAIDSLGDKVSARHIAGRAGAPMAPGTPDPIESAGEAVAFASEHGLPIVIKAAFGGGGRGMRVARTLEEIPEMFDAATREAISAFGRGECFVERFLDKPRHVETQCLADKHGNVVVVSTRDCSLQRRHQKLVEEAPAPFLSDAQNTELVAASKAILREANYDGAGTVEFLVAPDGLISFLEVNTRLQVEHPVSEEVTGIDLVREQIRIANGEVLGYGDPEVRGHSIEFRLNGEDPGKGFLPSPGTISTLRWPSGPGIRVDTGVIEGDTISGAFDSMVAKLIVTGSTRRQAIERSRRALRELTIEGIPTVAPFDRIVLDAPQFAADSAADFTVHTRWIETEFADNVSALASASPAVAASAPETEHQGESERVVVEVGGRRLEVVLPAGLGMAAGRTRASAGSGAAGAAIRRPGRRTSGPAKVAVSGNTLAAPMQGTIISVAVADGAQVAEGDTVAVLEAMKMEQPVLAHRAGVVSGLSIAPGDGVTAGQALCEIA
ncbi:MAG: ATP-grasp domain-containing protein [Cellulomonadaceae bacterium]|nr:ATP-grasp domain-containing protein [Cellulomonadaceae bacterium]